MKKKKIIGGLVTLTSLVLLAACSPQESGSQAPTESSVESQVTSESESSEDTMHEDTMHEDTMHEDMMHDDSGEIPEGLQEAENPTYSVGDAVTIETGHMPGMEGAAGTVVGAFDTIAYEVSYDPTNGDPRVENHK